MIQGFVDLIGRQQQPQQQQLLQQQQQQQQLQQQQKENQEQQQQEQEQKENKELRQQEQEQEQEHHQKERQKQFRAKESSQEDSISKISQTRECDEVVTVYHHFFSKDASLVSGKYMFKFDCANISSIAIKDFNFSCNVYNITELNNKFTVTEKATRTQISLPLGYYKIDELVHAIEDTLNTISPNKLIYQVSLSPNKNKISFKCSKDTIPHNFNIQFPKETRNVRFTYSLQEILGFKMGDYMNNSFYISEYHPNDNLLENVMVKIFLDGYEVSRYASSNQSFGYFERFSIDMNALFGKRFSPSIFDSPFDISSKLDCRELAIELWNSDTHIMSRYANFDIVFAFEKST